MGNIHLAPACCALLLGCASARPAEAPAPRAKVMVLGTFHMDRSATNNYVQSDVRDVMSVEGQAELERLVEALGRFRPTKIAVEWPAAGARGLDDQLSEYLKGTLTPKSNEIHQVAFRLAKRLGHERVYAIDYRTDMRVGPLLEAGRRQFGQEALVGELLAALEEVQRQQDSEARQPVALTLRQLNDPRAIDEGHALYLRLARIGAGEQLAGADEVAGWLERNLKIYVHLRQIIDSPRDRVLVLFGSGHAKLLRDHVIDSGELELVDPLPFLPER